LFPQIEVNHFGRHFLLNKRVIARLMANLVPNNRADRVKLYFLCFHESWSAVWADGGCTENLAEIKLLFIES